MEQVDLIPLIEDLSSNIDDLEEALAPLLQAPLRDTASKLPLLDKAKLQVLTTYSIESILFSYLNLNSVNAKEHAVFNELARVKQYFGKIKTAEEGPPQRPSDRTLDKTAAGRFIKHGLAGNEKYDQERAQHQNRERKGAKIKFDELSERIEQDRIAKELKGAQNSKSEVEQSSEDSDSSSRSDEELEAKDGDLATAQAPSTAKSSKKRKSDADKTEKHSNKRGRTAKSSEPPRSHSDTFKALLNGPLPKKGQQKQKKSKN